MSMQAVALILNMYYSIVFACFWRQMPFRSCGGSEARFCPFSSEIKIIIRLFKFCNMLFYCEKDYDT